jgi:O-antigen/teichoic acid export membrane protein
MTNAIAAPARSPGTPRQDTSSSRPSGDGWYLGAGILSASTVLISAGNYAYSLIAVRTLKPAEFSRFSAAQALLLVLGTGCMAAIPWAMARSMAINDSAQARREALHFGLAASLIQGLVAAPVAGLVLWALAGPAVGLVTGIAALCLSLVAAPIGFLQGEDRIASIVGLRLIEFVSRLGVGITALAVVAQSSAMALLGFPVASGLLFALGLWASRRGFPLRRGDARAVRMLVRQSLALGAVQVSLSALGAIDALAAEASGFTDATSGSYQVAAVLGRIPLFVSIAVSMAAYTAIARAADGREVSQHLRRAVALYAALAIPTVLACWTVPGDVIAIVVPDAYTGVVELLRYTSLAGAAVGLISVLTTAHQARGRFRKALMILVPIAGLEPVLLIAAGRAGGSIAFAVALVATTGLAALLIARDARRWSPMTLPRPCIGWPLAVVLAAGAAATSVALLWLVAIAGLFALFSWHALRPVRDAPEGERV